MAEKNNQNTHPVSPPAPGSAVNNQSLVINRQVPCFPDPLQPDSLIPRPPLVSLSSAQASCLLSPAHASYLAHLAKNSSLSRSYSHQCTTPLYCKGALSCFFDKFLQDYLHNSCDSKMLRFVLNFEFWSFEFVSDLVFRIWLRLSEAKPRQALCGSSFASWWLRGYQSILQNKPNFRKPKTTATPCVTKNYEQKPPRTHSKKQTQSNPTCRGEARLWRGEAGTNPTCRRETQPGRGEAGFHAIRNARYSIRSTHPLSLPLAPFILYNCSVVPEGPIHRFVAGEARIERRDTKYEIREYDC